MLAMAKSPERDQFPDRGSPSGEEAAVVDAREALNKSVSASQRIALGLASEAFEGVVRASRAGISEPQEALNRITALIAAIGDLAASSTKPMEALLVNQRNLANAMASFAQLQADMAEVLAQVAASHAAVVDALEMLATPALAVSDMIRSEPTMKKAQGRAQGRAQARKTPPPRRTSAKTGTTGASKRPTS